MADEYSQAVVQRGKDDYHIKHFCPEFTREVDDACDELRRYINVPPGVEIKTWGNFTRGRPMIAIRMGCDDKFWMQLYPSASVVPVMVHDMIQHLAIFIAGKKGQP